MKAKTGILPNRTPIGGFGFSVTGSDRKGTVSVFWDPISQTTSEFADVSICFAT